jgi:hypothetical protein
MKNREIGAILSTFEKLSTINFSVDEMAPIFPFFHFPVANFSAQRSNVTKTRGQRDQICPRKALKLSAAGQDDI